MSPEDLLDLEFLGLSLLLMRLTGLRNTGQVFCRMSLGLGLWDVFLIVTLGLWVLGRKTPEANVIPITSSQPDIAVDVDLGHLARVRVPHRDVTSSYPFFLFCTLWKKVTRCCPHGRSENSNPPPRG